MRFDSLIVARSASSTDDNLLDIVGSGITRVTAESFPWKEPTLVAIDRFRIEPEDFSRDTEVHLRVDTPAGVSIAHLQMTITPAMIGRLDDLPADEVRLLNLVGGLDGIVFAEEGTYRIVTAVGGVTVDDYPLVVVPPQLELVPVDHDDAPSTESPPVVPS